MNIDDTTATLSARLIGVLAPVLGDGTIEGLRRLTGGASRATWAFDAITAAGRRALILRTGPPAETQVIHAGIKLEARAQAAARTAGAPVPDILIADTSPAALGNPFLICAETRGETVVRRIDRALDDAGRAHSGLIDQDQLASCRSQLDAIGDTTATFEWAFRWPAARRPTAAPACLCTATSGWAT